SGEEAGVPVHDLIDQPAEEAGCGVMVWCARLECRSPPSARLRESGDPGQNARTFVGPWTPASAGVSGEKKRAQQTPLIPAQAGIQGYTKALTLRPGPRFCGGERRKETRATNSAHSRASGNPAPQRRPSRLVPDPAFAGVCGEKKHTQQTPLIPAQAGIQ